VDGMSIHGQSNYDIRRPQPFSSKPKENVQGPHGKAPGISVI